MAIYKNLSDFGVKTHFKIIGYKGGRLSQILLKNNSWVGKQLWYNKKLYNCIKSTTNTATIIVDGKEVNIHRKDTIAPKGSIPIYKQKTVPELLEEIRVNYPDAKLHVPKVGCQLHGDIDAVLTIQGFEYYIPWNY